MNQVVASQLAQSAAVGQDRLVAKNVTKRYWLARDQRDLLALDRISLSVRSGEFACIVGPSGCGKTTFMNMVAGLLPYDEGDLLLNGKRITAPGTDRAVVFQQSSLLPWRTVRGNVLYGMQMHKRFSRAEQEQRAEHFIQLVGLGAFANSYPGELSGGMQQRVNLARALATDPELLLMDEPFAALDAQTREIMQAELLKIWAQAKKTVLFITHQINEAIYLADRVFVFGSRPGHLKAVLDVPFDRPRGLSLKRDPRFLQLEDEIWSLIEEEALWAVGSGTEG